MTLYTLEVLNNFVKVQIKANHLGKMTIKTVDKMHPNFLEYVLSKQTGQRHGLGSKVED
jgi:hypothetical protein